MNLMPIFINTCLASPRLQNTPGRRGSGYERLASNNLGCVTIVTCADNLTHETRLCMDLNAVVTQFQGLSPTIQHDLLWDLAQKCEVITRYTRLHCKL